MTRRKLDWLVKACTTRLREPDHEAQREAIAAMNASRKAFDHAHEAQERSDRVDRSIAEQEKQRWRWGIGGLITGPLDMADAGIRVLVAGNSVMADAIGDGVQLVTDNRTVFDGCQRRAAKERRAVRCGALSRWRHGRHHNLRTDRSSGHITHARRLISKQ